MPWPPDPAHQVAHLFHKMCDARRVEALDMGVQGLRSLLLVDRGIR
jgi:hypothetical protein